LEIQDINIDILIVDDEEEVRDLLQIMLRSYPGSRVIGQAENVESAIRLSRELKPNLVLLDIQMPFQDGFDYLNGIRELNLHPGIIFVTAYENYAIKAIRNAAFDYILKPVNKIELFHALDRFKESLARKNHGEISELIDLLNKSKPGKLRMNTRNGFFFVDPQEIVYCEADGNYSHIWLSNGKKEISTLNLGNMEKMFNREVFLRISRSYIVNMDYVTRVDRKSNICELEIGDISFKLKVPGQNLKILDDFFD